jgi:hypothetical protein
MNEIACSLDQPALADRRTRWLALADQLVGIELTAQGQRLTFRADAQGELLALAELERECCAFAEWAVAAEDGIAVLEVTGDSPEAVVAVQAMFGPLRAELA